MNEILILTIVLLFLSQVNSRYMQYNNLQSKLNPMQDNALNEDPNQRLKESQLFRNNDNNNYLSSDDYEHFGGGMGQSQFKDYDVDYGASRLNEGENRIIDPRYKKGAFENQHSNVGYWYPGLSRYPARYEDSKSLSKRSSEESSGQQEQASASVSGNSKSENPSQSSASASDSAASAVAEKRENKDIEKEKEKDEERESRELPNSSNEKSKNKETEVGVKGQSSLDVKRTNRETEEDECEEEGGEPESDSDEAWYDGEEDEEGNKESRQPVREDRQATHIFSSEKAMDKSNLIPEKDKALLKSLSKEDLSSEDHMESDSLVPHLSIRKRNIPSPRARRHLGSYNYGYDEEDEDDLKKRHAFESNYDANDSDYLLDYDDQGSVRRRRFINRRNKRQTDTNSTTITPPNNNLGSLDSHQSTPLPLK